MGKYGKLSDEEILAANQLLLERLQDVLGGYDWDDTLFLKVNKKRIEDICLSTKELVDSLARNSAPGLFPTEADSMVSSEYSEKDAVDQGYVRIFVSLFVNEGSEIGHWEGAVCGLQSYTFGRPVYERRKNCEELIRSKSNTMNEGYAIIDVSPDMLIKRPESRRLRDRFDNELVTLRQGAIVMRNIRGFVHGDGRGFYKFYARKLVKINSYELIFDFT